MAKLILVRHGISEWNAKGLWTGLTDISLTKQGYEEAQKAGASLRDLEIDIAFVSKLKRALETLNEIEKTLGVKFPTVESATLNERSYGDYTGMNKWEIKAKVGEDEFQKIRRSWDEPVPGGETLKDVYNRAVPFFQDKILPELKAGKNVLVSAHHNSIRAIVKFLENISDDEIANLEIGTGEVYIYDIDSSGKVIDKEIRSVNPNTGKI